ncbi:NeuD/PglB/VioB family sugar acetyltransferase [Flavobacterium sp. RSB2_4_14]|uniref:NeuD/PglB/VioB family sugar acetyltransferase n=1 Tax=Flavobacterium sp. RSB2_4_14 TaxID=3447665 RepID=UPI003F3E432E
MRNLVIIGASGFAREMYDLALACYGNQSDFRIKGFLSDNPSNIEDLGYPPVLNTVTDYEPVDGDVFFCAIGNLYHRKKTVEIILSKGGKFINLIHPTAIISPSVKLGIGVGIKSFCVLASDVTVEDFTFLQSSVIMGHDVHIGRFCQVNSFSFFAGYVRVHDMVSVNAGVRIIQNIVVEEESVVGIGSVVLHRVRKNTTVFGNPAKRIVL